jgi:hypothetical protein
VPDESVRDGASHRFEVYSGAGAASANARISYNLRMIIVAILIVSMLVFRGLGALGVAAFETWDYKWFVIRDCPLGA